MAEEEVLDETPVAAKKEKGGGITFGQLIGIGVLLIIVTVGGTLMVSGKLSSLSGSLEDSITSLKTGQQGILAETQGLAKVGDCEQIYAVSEEPMIVNMADGEHYISAEIAVCVEGKKITQEEFDMRIPQIRHVINDTLSRVQRADLFGAGVSKAQQDEMDALGLEAGGDSSDALAKNIDKLRGTLLQRLSGNFTWITDVYFSAFLVQ